MELTTRQQNIGEIVKNIIHGILPDEDLTNLDGDKKLRDIGLESMDFLDVLLDLRKKYNLEVPEADYSEFKTLNTSIMYLDKRLPANI